MTLKPSHLLLIAAACFAGRFAAPAHALVVDDFESYAADTFPSNWTDVENPHSTSPRVRDNANNLDGQHLEFSSPYNGDSGFGAESIGLTLPTSLSADGDYVQIAAMLPSSSADQIGAWMLLLGGPYPGGHHTVVGTVGLESWHGQFSHELPNTVHNTGDFGTAALDTWYYLRATMRDAGGAAGVIDSYDFQIFSDEAGTNLVDQKLGITFIGGEGPISDIALRTFPQSGDPHAVALFDSITMEAIPEPASLGLLALTAPLLLRRRVDR